MSKVALVRCESYDRQAVEAAVQRGLNLLGGPSAFVKPGERVLLKPNWIVAASPEKCATTHPAVFRAVCEAFSKTGAQLCYGDSPGHNTPEEAAKSTGCYEIGLEYGLDLADFESGKEITVKTGSVQREFLIANGVLGCDALISLSKLKTHAFLKLTGAVKNQLGCVPGKRKGAYHAQLVKPVDFARMLIDLNLYLKPRLYIMDGIIAMDGNGPMNGDPIKMNVLLFSNDPIALDATVCRIVDVNPEFSYTVTLGMKAGLGTFLENEIELVGDPLGSFVNKDFNLSRDPISNIQIGKGRFSFADAANVPSPYIVEERCKKCGVCVEMCPLVPKVVDWHDGDKSHAPTYRYDRCIRCFCCQEVCPEGAILVK
jgi:uncharacterized protein (DUF362 family)/NAD-dependent dihydropyrimidine dehydrogenase PreA subunit